MIRQLFFTLCLLACCPAAQAQTAETVQMKALADTAYVQNDYAAAIELYEQIAQSGWESAALYYNLGNSYYKTDQVAKSILNYERALLLAPADEDILFNLELARAKMVDKVTPRSEMFFVTWFRHLRNTLSASQWAWVGIISFLLFIVCLLVYLFGVQMVLRKIGFGMGVVALFVVLVANLLAFAQKERLQNRHEAIVMQPSITVKSTPHESGTDLFILHEGHKVTIRDNSMRNWVEISIEDGQVGWIPIGVITII